MVNENIRKKFRFVVVIWACDSRCKDHRLARIHPSHTHIGSLLSALTSRNSVLDHDQIQTESKKTLRLGIHVDKTTMSTEAIIFLRDALSFFAYLLHPFFPPKFLRNTYSLCIRIFFLTFESTGHLFCCFHLMIPFCRIVQRLRKDSF